MSEVEQSTVYESVKAVLEGETIIDYEMITNIYRAEQDIAENERLADMMHLLSGAGYTANDVELLQSYLKDNDV